MIRREGKRYVIKASRTRETQEYIEDVLSVRPGQLVRWFGSPPIFSSQPHINQPLSPIVRGFQADGVFD